MAWLSSWPAMVALGVATVLELVAYYVPVLDHFLDAIAVPLATVAGILVAISTFVDLPPMLAWGLAIIAGGGIAGLVSAGTATTRLASTGTTAGLGNPIVATAETAGSLVLSLLAWFLPLVGLALVILVLYGVFRLFKRSSAPSPWRLS